jgi:hypothetical protein
MPLFVKSGAKTSGLMRCGDNTPVPASKVFLLLFLQKKKRLLQPY